MAARVLFGGISMQPVRDAVPAAGCALAQHRGAIQHVHFLLQGGQVSGHHDAWFAMEKNPFPFRTSMVKVTVNLSLAFGAHRLYQSAEYHWITVYTTRFAVEVHCQFFFLFLYLSPAGFFSRSLDNAANLHNTTFA